MQDFSGKVAIVSGGANSIGAQVARRLVAVGAKVGILDIDAPASTALVNELGSSSAQFLGADLGEDDEIAQAIGDAVSAFGRLDMLINAAAIYDDAGASSTRAQWRRTFEANVFGQARLISLAHLHLAASRGCIVNIGSVSARAGQAGRWTYPASKAALVQLTRAVAIDFAGDGIRANCVSPGWTWSGSMAAMGLARAQIDAVAGGFHLFGRAADPDEIAGPVLYLCSDDARFVTGANWEVDGGYTAMGPEGPHSAIAKLSEG